MSRVNGVVKNSWKRNRNRGDQNRSAVLGIGTDVYVEELMDKTGARRGEQTGKERAMRQWTPYRKAQKNKAQRQNKCPRNMKLRGRGLAK